ncbi:MAG: alpha-amylase family glycosyl hydrolase [Bacteroidales bacterium]
MRNSGRLLLGISLCLSTIFKAEAGNPSWLDKAVFYQVYPSSFKDSNNDGIGDIKGIESKLDYIKSIGINTIWINPVFCSEFFDGGYDVTDFYKVDPRYGTNTDLVELINKVHEKKMRICMDLVAGHTSDKHPWFLESSQKDNNLQYSDYYIWTDSISQKGKNYVSTQTPRNGNYMKNYFDCQPALNFGFNNPDPTNPWEQPVDAPGPMALRREMKNIMAFWMDKGFDGIRVDMAYSLIKNDPDFTGTMNLWSDISGWFKKNYSEKALIAEWGNPKKAIQGGFDIDFMFHIGVQGYTSLFYNKKKQNDIDCYFGLEGKGEIKKFMDAFEEEYAAVKNKGYISLPTSNHDIWRLACGKRDSDEQLKVAMTFLFTMPTIPFLYYGDELGMRFIEGLPNVEGSQLASRNRAGSRTPMQWDMTFNAGFSGAETDKLYIPIDPAKQIPNVAQQENDPESMLNYIRKLIRIRQESEALGNNGDWKLISSKDQPYPLIYLREKKNKRFCVIINPSKNKVEAKVPTLNSKEQQVILGNRKKMTFNSGKETDLIKIKPVSSVILKLQ